MRAAVAWLLALGFSQTLCGQHIADSQSPALAHACTIGSVPELEKAPSLQLQSKIDALRHRDIYACARAGTLVWAEQVSFLQVTTVAQCDAMKRRYARPEFPPMQPLRIEDAGYSSDPSPRVVLLFRLPSGRHVKLTFSPDDRAWQSDDPLPILAYESGLYLDPYNSPFTPAEVESIQHMDFPVGTPREALDCVGVFKPQNEWRDSHKRQWWTFDGRAYRFDNEGRVAETRRIADLIP